MIISNEFDTLFYQASLGDEKSLNLLLQKFISEGKKLIYKRGEKLNENYEFFYEIITESFMVCLNTFDINNARFQTYATVVLERRINNAINELRRQRKEQPVSLDSNDSDNRPMLEYIEDKTIVPIPNEYSIKTFKIKMSSPLYKGSKNMCLRLKINKMLLAGYSREEICKTLKISLGTLRYNIKLNNDDKELSNLKLELK
mgnify:CR=1 FL=1